MRPLLPQLLAAPAAAGLLFLLPPSIAQANTDSSRPLWRELVGNLLKLVEDEDISNKDLKQEILSLIEKKSDDNISIQNQIDDLRGQIQNQASNDTKSILDEIKENLSKEFRIIRLASTKQDLRKLEKKLVKFGENLRISKKDLGAIKNETDKIQDLERKLRNIQSDIEYIKDSIDNLNSTSSP